MKQWRDVSETGTKVGIFATAVSETLACGLFLPV